MSEAVYADYNATPVRPAAAEAVARALAAGGNASSVHRAGRTAKATLEAAREQLARKVGARARDIVFTGGATEALHLALDAAAGAYGDLLVSEIEHDAVWDEAHRRTCRGFPCNKDGVVDLAAFECALADADRPLVALMLANNETGAIQPVAEAARLVREAGGSLLIDAAQALGRIDIDLPALDATYLVVSSHKCGGPPGAGALVLAPGAPFAITRRGGGQEQGRRPGTENVPAIAGFAAALDVGADEIARVRAIRDDFEQMVRAAHPDAVVFGAHAPRLPNTSLFALPGLAAETALIALDLEGVALSSGAACSSGKVKSSRVLAAMGVAPALARCALRASFGWASRADDPARILSALTAARTRRAEDAA
jgi:cysteine desulfurase